MRLLACLVSLLFLHGFTIASEPAFLDECIEVSPRVLQGELPNGLRYALMRQAFPEGRISMRLLLKAGALHEADEERGYAHFVEHMAFNGTRNYPSGELVRSLQREGVSFGAHFTASTTVTRTLYKLDLPNTQPELFQRALTIFSDFAEGLLFESKEVEKERGVILSEDLTRRNDQREEALARQAFILRGALAARRDPIGTLESVKQATPEKLRRFYDAWYRPELMTVIIVGDIDPAAAKSALEARFQSLRARGPARPAPASGLLEERTQPDAAVHFRAGKGLQLNVTHVWPRPKVPAEQRTWRRMKANLSRDLANRMIQGRLSRLALREDRILSDSDLGFDHWFDQFSVESLTVNGAPDNCNQVLSVGEKELRRALSHGFDQSELELVRARWRLSISEYAQSVPTRPSQDIMSNLVDSLSDPQSTVRFVDENLDRTLAVIDSITVADCHEAFVKAWKGAAPLIFASVPKGAPVTKERLVQAWLESTKVDVSLVSAIKQVSFAYDDFGPSASVIEKIYDSSLDFWTVQLSNGVRLNIKKTAHEPNELRMSLRIGQGRLVEPKEHPGIGLWTGEWMMGGLGRHSPEELALLSPTGRLSIEASADTDALTLVGHASSANLRRLLATVTAQVMDSSFRPDAHEKMGARLNGYINPLLRSPSIVLQAKFVPILAGGDKRLGLPKGLDVKPEKVKEWIKSQLSRGRVELSLVGDFDVEACISVVASTLGTLPKREDFIEAKELRTLNFSKTPQVSSANYEASKERPVSLYFAWPVRDPLDSESRLRLRLLAAVLESRLHEQLREDRGSSYASSAGLWTFDDAYPGMCYLHCELEVQPKLSRRLGNETLRIAGDLRRKGPTEDELLRVKAQFLSRLKADRAKNVYWLKEVLDGSYEKPWHLELARGAERILTETTRDALHALAKQYLGEKSYYRCDAKPVKK